MVAFSHGLSSVCACVVKEREISLPLLLRLPVLRPHPYKLILPDISPKAISLSSNTVTLRISVSIYEFGGDVIQSIVEINKVKLGADHIGSGGPL